MDDPALPELTEDDRAIYEWQMWVDGIGETGQRKLKAARVLISRVGGLGGIVAYQLAAAGVGTLVLAHAGNIRPSDLNRQLLMTHDAIGTGRIESATRRLRDLNPRIEIIPIAENITIDNADRLVAMVDVVASCVPLFQERLRINAAAVALRKPVVDCAMYELSGQLTTIVPGRSSCLACRIPEAPVSWKRAFPVFGAVSGTVGCLGAMEVIKLITGIGVPLLDRLLTIDLREMRFRTIQLQRNANCPVCASLPMKDP